MISKFIYDVWFWMNISINELIYDMIYDVHNYDNQIQTNNNKQ